MVQFGWGELRAEMRHRRREAMEEGRGSVGWYVARRGKAEAHVCPCQLAHVSRGFG